MQRNFKRDDAAQANGKRGAIQRGHSRVGNNDGVAREFFFVRLEKRVETRAADFFFAFEHESQIAGQGRAGFDVGFDGFEMREVLTLVVRAAAREKISSLDARLERWRLPQVKRLGGLHIVVAIDHEMFAAFGFHARRGGGDDGMALGRMDFGVQADVPTMFRQPFRAREQVGVMFGLRGDAGEAQVGAELREEPFLILFEVVENRLHRLMLEGFIKLHNGIDGEMSFARIAASVKEHILSEHGESSGERWFSDDLKPGSREQSEKQVA